MKHIAVTNGTNRDNLRQIIVKADVFNSREFVSIHKVDKLIIRKPTIDDNMKFNKFCRQKNHLQATIISRISTGKYLIDEEESNEDQIVIYYEDLIKQ